jgi:hypothetical protein
VGLADLASPLLRQRRPSGRRFCFGDLAPGFDESPLPIPDFVGCDPAISSAAETCEDAHVLNPEAIP